MASSAGDDAARLDRLLADPDPALLVSLARQDRRRTRLRYRRVACWTGSIVLAGWLAAAGGRMADSPRSREDRGQANVSTTGLALRGTTDERVSWLLARGGQLTARGRGREAATVYQLASDLEPEAVAAWNGLGWSLYRRGHAEAAKDAFERGFERDRTHRGVRRGLGNLAFAAGDYATAAGHWRHVARDRHLAAALLLTERYREASAVLDALRVDGVADELVLAMADAASRRTLDEDLAWILRHRDLRAGADLRRARAWSAYYRQRNAEAERAFSALLTSDPRDADAAIGLGFALIELGRVGEARQRFDAVLRTVADHAPEQAAARNGLAICARAEGRLDEAIAGWERLQQKIPAARSPGQHLPFAYLVRGDHDQALPGLLRLAAHHPDDRRVLAGLEQALAGVVRPRPDDA